MNNLYSFFSRLRHFPIPSRTAVMLVALAWSNLASAQQLLQSSFSGTLTIGDIRFQIVGGMVINHKYPMMIMHAENFKLNFAEIDASQWPLGDDRILANNGVATVSNYTLNAIEFNNAEFPSPEPQRNSDGTASLPFPFAVCLSPSAGAIWKGEVPLAALHDGVWSVSRVVPDIYIRAETNQDGKVLLRAQNFFVATKTNELALTNAIRFEQVSFANPVTFEANGTQFSLKRMAFAFQGKDVAAPRPNRVSVDVSLANKQEWSIENGSSKQYLTEFRLASDGHCSAVYGNGLVVTVEAADTLRKDIKASVETAGSHFSELIKSVLK
jgi:hypothetical protein